MNHHNCVEKIKYQWEMCHPHAICTLEYFPNHYWSALLQPLPSLPVKLMDAKSRWRKKWLLPGWSTNQISDKNHFGMIERSWNQGEKCVCVWFLNAPHTGLDALSYYLCRSHSCPSCSHLDTRCTSCPSLPSCKSTDPTSAHNHPGLSP